MWSLLLIAATCPLWAGPIEILKPGEWVELPCVNKIRNVLPNPVPSGNGPVSIITAWNSGAYDTKRDRYIIHGGGHYDYQGNEIYVFDLAALKWTRLTDPSSAPVSIHTYDGLEYLPRQDFFFRQGGSVWPSGWGTNQTWIFNFGLAQWQPGPDHPSGGGLGNVSAYDPVTGRLFWDGAGNSSDHLWEFDPAAKKWTSRGNTPAGNYHQTAALDPRRRKFFRVGDGEMQEYDITAAGNCPLRTLVTSGSTAMVASSYPGVEYDPVGENLVAWNGGTSIYSYNPDTKAWSEHATSGADPGATAVWGTFNHWRYVPSRNVFIVVNSIDANVFAYRHTADSAAPKWYLDLLNGVGTGPEAFRQCSAGRPVLTTFPNPVRSTGFLKISGAPGGTTVRIIDSRGRLIGKFAADPSGRAVLSVSGAAPGLYVASVHFGPMALKKAILVLP